MKRLLSLTIAALVALFLAAAPASAQQAGKEKKARRAPIRVLLVTGGHAFQEKEFYAMWDAFRGVNYDKLQIPAQADQLKPGLEEKYDVIVMYDMCKAFSPEQQKNFVELIKGGKIGLVSLHHDLGAHPDWAEFHKIIGGEYVMKPRVIDGKQHPGSTYDHDQEVNVTVADPKHPITRNMENFTIHDETYGNCYVSPQVHVLLTTDHPKGTKQIAWTNDYEQAKVFHLMLGHDAKAWENPAFKTLLERGIRWSYRESHGGRQAARKQ